MGPSHGTLVVARRPSIDGPVVEEELFFTSLEGLLALCVGQQGAGLLRVTVTGAVAGQLQRLVLDFGQFGPSPEQREQA